MIKKTFRFLAICTAIIAATFALTSCDSIQTTSSASKDTQTSQNLTTEQSTTITEMSGSAHSDNLIEESVLEENSVSEVSDEASSPESSVSEQEESSQSDFPYTSDDENIEESTHTQPSYTDNSDFNTLFSKNPLDASYQQAMADATEASMNNIALQYISYWQTEVENAYNTLLTLTDSPDTLTSEQKAWSMETETQKQEIYDNVIGGEGTLAILSVHTEVMSLYKNRAAALYEKIYTLSGEFNLAFMG